MFRMVKFRTMKVVGVAALTASTAVVAAGPHVDALDGFGVPILYEGDFPDRGWIAIRAGSTFELEADTSTDLPVHYEWAVNSNPEYGGITGGGDGRTVTLLCPNTEAILEVTVTVTDEDGEQGSGGLDVFCQELPDVEISPEPLFPGEREFVPLGTTITFTSVNWVSDIYDSEWRTTGVKGVAGRGQTFTRTFDQVGNFGVELTDTNEVGRASLWVGYTVIGPPTVSVTPAPKPGENLRVEAGSTVTFSGAGSRSPGGGSLKYDWRSTGVRGVAGDQVTYTREFEKVGNYAVKLTVVNEFGDSVDQRIGISVFEPAAPVVSVTAAGLQPDGWMTVRAGSRVNFDGSASFDPDGGSLTYQWRTTGVRGIAGNGAVFNREFTKVGRFGVELVVIDDEGQRAKRWSGVNVVP